MLFLEVCDYGYSLCLVSHAKLLHDFFNFADALTGVECIGYTLHSVIGCSEICIAAKHGVIVEMTFSIYSQVGVPYKTLNELSVHTTARVIYDLF